MTKLDAIAAHTETTMTPELVRLFKAAGCSPTLCHACQRRIKSGMTFKLVAHSKRGIEPLTDEMCCDRCAGPELTKRDKRDANGYAPARPLSSSFGGYSRPSKQTPKEPTP